MMDEDPVFPRQAGNKANHVTFRATFRSCLGLTEVEQLKRLVTYGWMQIVSMFSFFMFLSLCTMSVAFVRFLCAPARSLFRTCTIASLAFLFFHRINVDRNQALSMRVG